MLNIINIFFSKRSPQETFEFCDLKKVMASRDEKNDCTVELSTRIYGTLGFYL